MSRFNINHLEPYEVEKSLANVRETYGQDYIDAVLKVLNSMEVYIKDYTLSPLDEECQMIRDFQHQIQEAQYNAFGLCFVISAFSRKWIVIDEEYLEKWFDWREQCKD